MLMISSVQKVWKNRKRHDEISSFSIWRTASTRSIHTQQKQKPENFHFLTHFLTHFLFCCGASFVCLSLFRLEKQTQMICVFCSSVVDENEPKITIPCMSFWTPAIRRSGAFLFVVVVVVVVVFLGLISFLGLHK